MPHETLRGPDVAGLLVRARAELGPDARVVSMRRLAKADGHGWELIGARTHEPILIGPGARPAHTVLSAMAPQLGDFASRRRGEPFVAALVGPTGSGKTTTIAKLANHPHVFGGARVGLLCLDTYRIGAVEQSRIYAELSRIPLEVAYSRDDLHGAMRRLRDRDVILVDTPGRGPARLGDLADVRRVLAPLKPAEVHLVLPAGLQPRLARRLAASHRALGLTHLVATKLDECPDDTVVFDLAAELGLPMRWCTDGQEVPADLRPASTYAPGAFATSTVAS